MGVWIRSQEKTNLLKPTDIYINEERELRAGFEGINYEPTGKFSIHCPNRRLGAYESRERALQVLDEIQHHIESSGRSNLFTVFQMPAE